MDYLYFSFKTSISLLQATISLILFFILTTNIDNGKGLCVEYCYSISNR